MNWHLKLIKDTVKAALPFQEALRAWKRHFLPYKSDLEADHLALCDGIEQIKILKLSGAKINGTVLDFGTGWMPIIPVLFCLAGARHIYLTDIHRLMDENTLEDAKNFVIDNIDKVASVLNVPGQELSEKLRNGMNYTYDVPWSGKRMPARSVDIIVSRDVMEHIRPNTLKDAVVDFRRILRPSGYMCHIIDNSDHWQHVDRSISRINFLRFSNKIWPYFLS